MDITWDKIEITQTEFETNTLGGTNAKVTVAYDYTKNPVTGATVSINGILCNEIEQGTYVCTIDGWSPLQSFDVKAESVGFEQNRTTVLSVHLMNTVFSVNNPIIKLGDMSETGKNIQQGFMQIYSGSMIGIRNPTAHENLDIKKEHAIHYLYLASLLMIKFDEKI